MTPRYRDESLNPPDNAAAPRYIMAYAYPRFRPRSTKTTGYDIPRRFPPVEYEQQGKVHFQTARNPCFSKTNEGNQFTKGVGSSVLSKTRWPQNEQSVPGCAARLPNKDLAPWSLKAKGPPTCLLSQTHPKFQATSTIGNRYQGTKPADIEDHAPIAMEGQPALAKRSASQSRRFPISMLIAVERIIGGIADSARPWRSIGGNETADSPTTRLSKRMTHSTWKIPRRRWLAIENSPSTNNACRQKSNRGALDIRRSLPTKRGPSGAPSPPCWHLH